MAYAALVSLEQIIEQVSEEHVIDQLPPHGQCFISFPIQDTNDYIHLCPKQQMKSLHGSTILLQNHLEEFPKKCVPLESRIRDVAHQLEDIIESFISGSPYIWFGNDDYGKELHSSHMFYAFCSCIQEVHSILEETSKMEINLEHDDDDMLWTGHPSSISAISGPRYGRDTMVGFEDDLNKILERATGHDRALQFIPIVGMGGIGKTTLARNVYDHPSIAHHFDIRSWVTVSQDYHLRDILLGLLSDKSETQEDNESLILRLSQRLNGRRFLIVLDDMWHGDVWDQIMRAIPDDDNNGSRIIITTRLSEVAAEIVSSSSIYQMKFLDENQSWFLLCLKVFGEDPCVPHQLETIGKTIARNCNGLPLAIIVIAGLLKVDFSQYYWEKIARNVSIAAADTLDDQLIGILSLSYGNLPHHLRACFLYMGVFQEDFVILNNKLIQMWVAEGFVKSQMHKSREKVADEYLEGLLNRGLVMVSRHENNEYISIHDMLRELCLRKGQAENFLQHWKYIDGDNCSRIIKGQHRLTVHLNDLELFMNSTHISPLRSVFFIGNKTLTSLAPFISQFKLLGKVYELSVRIDDLTSDSVIYKLIHLKYLSIVTIHDNYAHEIHVHASIVKLQNLQTLRLEFNYELVVVLPLDIWRMQKLRHLFLAVGDWSIPDLQDSSLSCNLRLQTLSSVENFNFTNDAIRRFTNLKRLGVKYSWDIVDCAEFGLNNLVDLHHLDELTFKFYGEGCSWTSNVFPPHLRKLTLSSCILSLEKMSNIASLNNLEFLDLYKCPFDGDEWEPIEDECFLRLKILKLRYLELRIWGVEDTHFPYLEELLISQCGFEIPPSIGGIDTLEKFTVTFCGEETNESALRIKEEQLNNGNDKLQFFITPL